MKTGGGRKKMEEKRKNGKKKDRTKQKVALVSRIRPAGTVHLAVENLALFRDTPEVNLDASSGRHGFKAFAWFLQV